MRSEPHAQLYQHQYRLMQNSNIAWNGGAQNVPSCGSQADTVEASTSETPFNFADGNLESDREDGNSIIPLKAIFSQPMVDNEMGSDTVLVGELYDDPSWRSLVSGFHLERLVDVDERKQSTESIDSDISLHTPSLDDVFQVIDEMDLFESGLAMNALLTTPSTDQMGYQSQSYSSNCLCQQPCANISSSDSYDSLQSSDLRLVKGLQNPSHGFVAAARRLCELHSKPRSDHLNFVFVRLLNNALKEMEDAVQHQSKRGNGESDAERTFDPVSTGLNHSFSSKSQSLSAFSTKRGSCTKTADLTGIEDCNKENFQLLQDSRAVEKEPLIALEDTVPDFMHEQFPFLLPI